MRLVFAGTPDAATPTLRRLALTHDIATVVTRPDAPRGRKRVLTPSPVAAVAEELGLPVLRAARLDDDATSRLAALRPDLGVIVAYGGLVREPLLSVPVHGWINLHFSLLPRWRGAAPVQHALIAGDDRLGTSVFQLVPALDAGDLLSSRESDIAADATAGDVLTQMSEEGADQVIDVVAAIAAGTAVAIPQQGAATLAPKLSAEDGLLTWTEPFTSIYARFRGVTPEPGAHTSVAGTRVKILDAVAGPADAAQSALEPGAILGVRDGVLIGTATTPLLVRRVQPAGKAPMAAADWWRGQRAGTEAGS